MAVRDLHLDVSPATVSAIDHVALGPALLAAADWFNAGFVELLHAKGWPRLSRSQARILMAIDETGTTPAELARRLEMTRQSMQELLRTMVEHGLLTERPHPSDRRALLIELTPDARRLGFDAFLAQQALDSELESRIGRADVADLKRILARDWGAPYGPALATDHRT